MNVNDQLIKRIHQKIIGGYNDNFYSVNDNNHIFAKCKACINNMFPNVNDIEKKTVLKYYVPLMTLIHQKFNVSSKINAITNDDYEDMLMMLFPFTEYRTDIKLNNVNHLIELFNTTKYNKYAINNNNVNNLNNAIETRCNSLRKTFNLCYNSFYPNWYTIYPKPFYSEYKRKIKLMQLELYDLWCICINLIQYDNQITHPFNRFEPFTVEINNNKRIIDKKYVIDLYDKVKPYLIRINTYSKNNDLIKINDDIFKRFNNNIQKDIIELITIYHYVSGTLSEYTTKPKVEINNDLDKCYCYLNNQTYNSIKKLNKIRIEENKKNMSTIEQNEYDEALIYNDFQLGKNIEQGRNIYGLRWIAQLKCFNTYLNTNIMFITGGTGVGKSTQIPKLISYASVALLFNHNSRTVCTEPRVDPVLNMKRFISPQMGIILPDKNGVCDENIQYHTQKYHHSNDNYKSPIFKIITDGTLMNELNISKNFLINDKNVKKEFKIICDNTKDFNYDIHKDIFNNLLDYDSKYNTNYCHQFQLYHNVIIDEVHEHNNYMDLILTIMNYLLIQGKPIKLILITATIENDEELFRKFFYFNNKYYVDNRCNFSQPGKLTTYNITEHYDNSITDVKTKSEKDKNEMILKLINSFDNTKDILVFKSGEADVINCVNYLNNSIRTSEYIAVPFFSRITNELKQYLMSNSHSMKLSKSKISIVDYDFNMMQYENDAMSYNKYIIVATNIAEASITLPSLTHVIDDGLQKKKIFDYSTLNDSNLQLVPINEINRQQRAGRVGRKADGDAYFLYRKGLLTEQKVYYGITTTDIRPFIFKFMPSNYESSLMEIDEYSLFYNNTRININKQIISKQFYLMHPLILYQEKYKNVDLNNTMLGLMNNYYDFGLIDKDVHGKHMFIKNKFGTYITSLTNSLPLLQLQDVLCIINAYQLNCVEEMINLISIKSFKDSLIIMNLIKNYPSNKKSDYLTLANYLTAVEYKLFNGSLNNFLINLLNEANVKNYTKAKEYINDIFTLYISDDSLSQRINKLNQKNIKLLDVNNFVIGEIGEKRKAKLISFKNKLLTALTNYFTTKCDIVLNLLLINKTIDNKHFVNNNITSYYKVQDVNTFNTVDEIIKSQSLYDRISYLLVRYDTSNVLMNVVNKKLSDDSELYINIVDMNIYYLLKYTYYFEDIYKPRASLSTYYYSKQPSSLFVYSMDQITITKTINYNAIEINGFFFKHIINNNLLKFMPKTIMSNYHNITASNDNQTELIDMMTSF